MVAEQRQKGEKYPSAEIVYSVCYEDYMRCLDTYDKLYEKINIALAFCGVIMLVILSSFNYTVIIRLIREEDTLVFFSLLVYLVCSVISIYCIIWAVVKLLLLLRSISVVVFDSVACRNMKIYEQIPEDAYLWLIDKYNYATIEMKKLNDKKNVEYNKVITKIVISLLSYAVVIVLNKGV